MADKPSTKFTDAAKIPAYLWQNGKFCLWKYENRDGKRWTKVPYQPKATQYGAASTNPAHFTDINTALDHAQGFDGIGLGIFGDIGAIDIDHCINEGGELSQLAQTVIETMDSYTEYSPSGKGIRIIFRAAGVQYDKDAYYTNNQDARDPRQAWPEKQGLEVYIAGVTSKYVTITGNAIRAVELKERSAEVKQILDRYMKKPTAARPTPVSAPSVRLSDRDLIETATRARNGEEFSKLYFGGDISGHPSQSEADLALMNHLCFYTAGDADRMIQLFKASALYRPQKSGGDKYLERTAKKAIRDSSTYYTAPQPRMDAAFYKSTAQAEEPQEIAPATTAAAVDAFLERARSRDFEPIPTGYKTIDSAIGGGFIRQTLVFLGASPGAGKTILAQQIVERIAKEQRANVLFYNLEMSTEQLIARSLSRAVELPPLSILQGYRWTPQQEESIRAAANRYKEEIAPRIKYNPHACANPEQKANYLQILASMEEEAEALEEAGSPLPLVVVIDYLQLLRSEDKDPVETIKAAVIAFKDFAIKRNAVVIMVMAHSRDTNEKGKITQGAGRDTSAIEYSGDLQMSLNYANYKTFEPFDEKELKAMRDNAKEAEKRGDAKEARLMRAGRLLTITKNRFGQEWASVGIYLFGDQSQFTESETIREETQRKKPLLR